MQKNFKKIRIVNGNWEKLVKSMQKNIKNLLDQKIN